MITAKPTTSPWGAIDDAEQLAPGWWSVSTSSHGGYVISQDRISKIPAAVLAKTFNDGQGLRGYFEEDCDACLPIHFFRDEFRNIMAKKGLNEHRISEILETARFMAQKYGVSE